MKQGGHKEQLSLLSLTFWDWTRSPNRQCNCVEDSHRAIGGREETYPKGEPQLCNYGESIATGIAGDM